MLGCRVSGFRARLLVTWIEAVVRCVLSTNAACKVFPVHTRLTGRLSCAGTDFGRPAIFRAGQVVFAALRIVLVACLFVARALSCNSKYSIFIFYHIHDCCRLCLWHICDSVHWSCFRETAKMQRTGYSP